MAAGLAAFGGVRRCRLPSRLACPIGAFPLSNRLLWRLTILGNGRTLIREPRPPYTTLRDATKNPLPAFADSGLVFARGARIIREGSEYGAERPMWVEREVPHSPELFCASCVSGTECRFRVATMFCRVASPKATVYGAVPRAWKARRR